MDATPPTKAASPQRQAASPRVVGGYRFNVLPCIEGRWSGGARRASVPPVEEGQGGGREDGDAATASLPPSSLLPPWPCAPAHAASTKISYVEGDGGEDGGYWTLRETQAAKDGMSSVLHLKLLPIADGRLRVEPCCNGGSGGADSESLQSSTISSGLQVELIEKSFGAQLVGISTATKEMEVFWIVKLTRNGELERTILSYKGGLLSTVCHVLERRVK